MKKNIFSSTAHFFMLMMLGSAYLVTTLNSCTILKGPYTLYPTSETHYSDASKTKWLSWNIMFSPDADGATRAQQELAAENYINSYLAPYGFIANFNRIYCPCDSTLFNLTAIPVPVQGSGGSLQTPPQQPPPPGASGGNSPYTVCVNNNIDPDMPLSDDPNNPNYYYPVSSSSKFSIDHNKPINEAKILAIMDTGLDPDKFDNGIDKLIWRDPHDRTLRNFFAFNNSQFRSDYGMDDYVGKHGSAVTMIALKAMESSTVYPKIMVLKVLDAKETGSTFNVGCALSYAIQNRATIVNASLGYYDKTGIPDPVLSHYLQLSANPHGTDSIFIFAAAGNTSQPHNKSLLCGVATPKSNELYKNSAAAHLFYPACFSAEMPNVISVTGLQDMTQSCYFQNFSNKYVSLGVLNADTGSAPTCCQFALPALGYIFEGSSFATPVATGKAMAKVLGTVGAAQISVRQGLNLVINKNSGLLSVTKDGKFIGTAASQ